MRLVQKLQASKFLFFSLAAYILIRIFYGGIYIPYKEISLGTAPSWMFFIKIKALTEFIYLHKPIALTYFRQPGPPLFFIMYPILMLTQDHMTLEVVGLLLSYLFTVLGFVITYRVLFPQDKGRVGLLLLAALWFCNSSLYVLIQTRNLETWELFFISLVLYGMVKPHKFLAGFGMATGLLLKFMPGVYFILALMRDRKVFFAGIFFFVLYLLAGHIAFGPDMGLNYFPTMLGRGVTPHTDGVTYFENMALKGFVYRLVSGFQINTHHPVEFVLSDARVSIAFWLTNFLEVTILGLAVWALYKTRNRNESKILDEFGLISSLMFLLIPGAGLEFTVILLIAFSVGLKRLFFDSKSVRPGEYVLFLGSYFLLAHFIPYGWALKFPLFPFIKQFGSGQFYGLSVDETYKAVGFPSLGCVMLYLFFLLPFLREIRSERKTEDSLVAATPIMV